jgi:hypothetical protein
MTLTFGGEVQTASRGEKMKLERVWCTLALVGGLIVAACFCFFRYLEWSFRYSAIVGLSSRAHETRVASHQSWMFFSMFIALEVCSAFVIGFPSEEPDFGSAWLRFLARYGLRFLLSLLATGVVVGLWLWLPLTRGWLA